MAGSTYLEGEGLDSVLASVNVSSGVVTSYATDALGSVVGVLNSSGSVAGSYGYDPYGNTAASGATSTLQYTGRENDGAYYYYRARYYDPATARFLSEDPLNIGGGANLYAYALGDPINNTDPSGEFVPLLAILPVIGGVIGGISDVATAGPCQDKLAAFGRGFVSGALGTLTGIGVTVATGNPFLAGAAGGEVASITDQGLAGEGMNPVDVAQSILTGGIGGKLLSLALPTVGRLPSLRLPRTLQNIGPNSQRLIGQEAGADALGGVTNYVINAVQSPAASACGCN